MSFTYKDIEVEIAPEAPFKEDKLNREQLAPILTTISRCLL